MDTGGIDILADVAARVPACGRDCLVRMTNATADAAAACRGGGDEAAVDATACLCEDDVGHYVAVLDCVRGACSLEESMGVSFVFSVLFSELPPSLPRINYLV